MSAGRIDRRYATALMRLCAGKADTARKRFEILQGVASLFEMESARKVLISPAIPESIKLEVMQYAIDKSDGKSDAEFRKFIEAIAKASRISHLPGIAQAFSDLLDSQEGVVKAEVVSAVALDKKDTDQLVEVLKSRVGGKGKVQLSQTVDASILGGIVIKLGNSIIDLSVKHKLDLIAKNARA